MKRDLKLNISHLDAISRKVQSYIDAMEAVELAARKFEQTIKDQDSDAYNKLSEQWETNVWENEKILKYRLGVIKEMIDSYISDMTDYIAPENETAMMRVDRNDIWWNYKQIEGEATSFDWIVQDTGSTPATYKRLFIPNPFSSDEENEAKKSAQQQEEDAIEGELRLVGEYEAGLTWRIDKNKMWESYFDRESGWYCMEIQY